MKYGLIGYPLGHSFSPAYFSGKFAREGISASYAAFPLQRVEEFPALLAAHSELQGLNVTTPYKQTIIPYLDELHEDAAAIGAVNCVSICEGKLTGYNTDWIGFGASIKPLLESHHQSALILGTGGASLAVCYALSRMGIPFQMVSRQLGIADLVYEDITPTIIQAHRIIINTTILGTEGVGCPKLPYDALTPQHLLYDLVYNPPLTPFLEQGLSRGAQVKNGQEMLILQAEASWDIWQQCQG